MTDAANSSYSLPFLVGRIWNGKKSAGHLYALSKKTGGYLKEAIGNANEGYQHQLIAQQLGLTEVSKSFQSENRQNYTNTISGHAKGLARILMTLHGLIAHWRFCMD